MPCPRQTLVDLAAAHGESLANLSALLGRNPAYLQQYVTRRSPRKLDEDDRYRLAVCFGVDECRLGAREPYRPA